MQTLNGSVSTQITLTTREKPQRHRFAPADKLRIVRDADACPAGTVDAFLRREAIYSSQLYPWRKQRDQGELEGVPDLGPHAA